GALSGRSRCSPLGRSDIPRHPSRASTPWTPQGRKRPPTLGSAARARIDELSKEASMSASRFALRAAAFAALVLLAPSLRANTYIVDSGGGGQFTDIQSAITAAQPGDVVLVHLG